MNNTFNRGGIFMIDLKKVRSALFGFAVGDALGVPVEFSSATDRRGERGVADGRTGGRGHSGHEYNDRYYGKYGTFA